MYSNYEACCYCYGASERNNLLNHESILRDNLNWRVFSSHVAGSPISYTIQDFFVRAEHETTTSSSGNHHLFTILCHRQTYKNHYWRQQKLVTHIAKKWWFALKMHGFRPNSNTQKLSFTRQYNAVIWQIFYNCAHKKTLLLAYKDQICHRHWQEAFKIAWITGWLLPIMHN